MKHLPTQSTDPLSCPDYQVVVNGRPVTVHGAKSCQAPFPFKVFKAGTHPGIKMARPDAKMGPAQIAEAGNAPYAFACFPAEGPVTVEIRSSRPLDKVQVRPARAATVERVDQHAMTLRLDGPTKVSVEPDGRHGGLLLFADEPETAIPDADDPKVHFYGPGLHRAGVIELKDGETLYLAPGAVVEGGVCIENAKDVRILGRGILCGDPWGWRAGPQKDLMMFTEAQGITVEGITLRCSWQWTFRMTGCREVTIRNVKIAGGKNLNDDGIDPSSCQNVLIEDCFIRTHDDNISVKAHCDDRRPSEHIEIRHCLHWSDLSRILMVGPESYADRIGDIHMHDCEVIYLGPPVNKTGFGDWDGCAPFVCIEAAEDCRMEEILIENVVVHLDEDRHRKDLIKIEPLITVFGKLDTMGTIRNITIRNLECLGPWQPRICIWGKDDEHDVRGVHFENVYIGGAPLDASYPQLSISEEHAADITFRSTL
jgi:hypothetical protein